MRQEVYETFRLAWPLAGAEVLSLSMVFVDTIVVAGLGSAALAAMAMASALVTTLAVLCIGMISPVSALISQAVGAGRPQDVGRTMHRALFLTLILASFSVAVCFFSDQILLAFRQDATLVPQARSFLLALSWGIPAGLLYQTLRQMTEGVSDTGPSVLVAGCAAILNAVLDYGLVYGHFGLPRLELFGAGLGTAICNWGMLLAMLAYIHLNPRYRIYALGASWRQKENPICPIAQDGHSMAEILRVGLPLSGSLLAEMAFFCGATLIMGAMGVTQLASHQIAINAASFAFMVPLGLSFAVAIRVSRARGALDDAGVRRAGEAGVFLTAITQTITGGAFLCLPWTIAHIYTRDPSLLTLAVPLLRIAGLFQWFDGFQVVGMGMLRGMLDTRLPFLATVVSYWLVGMPCAWFLAFKLGLGPAGVWYGMVAGLGVAALLLQARFWWMSARKSATHSHPCLVGPHDHQ